MNTSLVLSAGGARGAYQVGVLKAIRELSSDKKIPFSILCGVSAGSINAAMLAAYANDFETGVNVLEETWTNIKSRNVFRTDIGTISSVGMKWLKDLSLGGLTGGTTPKSLLKTGPLRKVLEKKVPIHQIKQNIESGNIKALTVTATDYYSAYAINFVQTKKDTPMWSKTRRIGEHADIDIRHLMASSAIPLFFPSEKIDGRHFGDGCIRNLSPLSPAIYLGSRKIIAIGVRRKNFMDESTITKPIPSVAHITGVLLDAILLDSIESDIIRMEKINQIIDKVGQTEKYKKIEALWISPSENVGKIALSYYKKLPRVIRYLLKGLGPDKQVSKIISFLLFDPTFCKKLIELGYKDGKNQSDQILSFLKTN